MAKEMKSIDRNQVIGFLNHSFANTADEIFGQRARATTNSNRKGLNTRALAQLDREENLYRFQVDFVYLVDEIQRGPRYMLPKVIAKANDLIAKLKAEK